MQVGLTCIHDTSACSGTWIRLCQHHTEVADPAVHATCYQQLPRMNNPIQHSFSEANTGKLRAMTDSKPAPDNEDGQPPQQANERLQLIWDVFTFQFKLLLDGLRDVLLSPLSIGSAIAGIVFGGKDPYRYYRPLLKLGRRSEIWINLFGHRQGRSTSDHLIEPLKQRVMAEAEANVWVRKAGEHLDRGRRGAPPADDTQPPSPAAARNTGAPQSEPGPPDPSEPPDNTQK